MTYEPHPLPPHETQHAHFQGNKIVSAEQIGRMQSALSIELYLRAHGTPLDRQGFGDT